MFLAWSATESTIAQLAGNAGQLAVAARAALFPIMLVLKTYGGHPFMVNTSGKDTQRHKGLGDIGCSIKSNVEAAVSGGTLFGSSLSLGVLLTSTMQGKVVHLDQVYGFVEMWVQTGSGAASLRCSGSLSRDVVYGIASVSAF